MSAWWLTPSPTPICTEIGRSAIMANRVALVFVTLASMLRQLPRRIGHHQYQ